MRLPALARIYKTACGIAPETAVMNSPTPTIERLSGPDAHALVDPLLREYMRWITDRLVTEYGVRLDDPRALEEAQHRALAGEMPQLLGPRGRLLVARVDGQPAGVCILKPVDAATGEVKRMYVRPQARGHGIGRALLARLIADARAEGYRKLRLESLGFMQEAQSLYRSLGFAGRPAFAGSQAKSADLEDFTCFMEAVLD